MSSDSENWFRETKSALLSGDTSRIAEQLYYAYSGLWLSLTSRYPVGTNVFERDWDVLLVLDACRVDAMREVAPEYSFIDRVDSIWSVGSTSSEWNVHTFAREYEEELSGTAVVSANPNTEAILRGNYLPPRHPTPFVDTKWDTVSADDLAYLELTRHHDHPYGELSDSVLEGESVEPPGYVTDRAIVAGRNGYERLIVHYFQPHRPFIRRLVEEGETLGQVAANPYDAGRNDLTTNEELWPLYLDNLRLVLDSVEVLLNNLDAETVAITADHGELLGELGQYGHFQSVPHPHLKKVPWVETAATDRRTRTPDVEYTESDTKDVKEQLQGLGYL